MSRLLVTSDPITTRLISEEGQFMKTAFALIVAATLRLSSTSSAQTADAQCDCQQTAVCIISPAATAAYYASDHNVRRPTARSLRSGDCLLRSDHSLLGSDHCLLRSDACHLSFS